MSRDVSVETRGQPLAARLVRLLEDDEHQIVVNGQVVSVEQAGAFAHALRRLVDQGTLATPGLGFVAHLAADHPISDEEMAETAGVDVRRVREQKRGGQVMTVHELDRLALAAAHLAAEREARSSQPSHRGTEMLELLPAPTG